jgi:hypothetical protein
VAGSQITSVSHRGGPSEVGALALRRGKIIMLTKALLPRQPPKYNRNSRIMGACGTRMIFRFIIYYHYMKDLVLLHTKALRAM